MTAAKKPTAAQVRERRARIAAVALGGVLVLVCAVQAVRLTRHGHRSTTPAAAVALPTAPGQAVALVSATVRSTHLTRLERFAWKDPFRQQLQPVAQHAPPAAPAPKTKPRPATPKKPAPETPKPPARNAVTVPASVPPAESKTFTPLPAKPVEAGRPGVLLLLDGRRLGLLPGDLFPTASPVFRLVSFTTRTARVALVGGTLSDGGETLKLRVGRRLVLRNATTDDRYVLELVRLARVVPRAAAPKG